MSRIPVALNAMLDYGFEGGPRYNTEEEETENGFTTREIGWEYPRHEYSASLADMPDDARDEVLALIHVCKGKAHSFLFRDWNDFAVVDQPLQVLPGTADTVQLYKAYTKGPAATYRPLQALDTTEVQPVVTDANGDPVAGVFDPLTGQFTPAGLWGGGAYYLTCQFFLWVRFRNDYSPLQLRSWQATTAPIDVEEDPFEFMPANVPRSPL